MRILHFFIIAAIFSLSSCFSSPKPTGGNNNNSGAPANTVGSPSTATPAPSRALTDNIETPTPVPTVEAVTLKPLVDKYCKARQDKDEATLRGLYSAATLKNLIADARAEGKKSVGEYLSVEPVGDKCSIYNERIVGNTGEATFSTKTYPNGITWKFVKENGEWKFTDQSSDFDKVKQDSKS